MIQPPLYLQVVCLFCASETGRGRISKGKTKKRARKKRKKKKRGGGYLRSSSSVSRQINGETKEKKEKHSPGFRRVHRFNPPRKTFHDSFPTMKNKPERRNRKKSSHETWQIKTQLR
ncbi:hypothetical protein LZ31DRAFT_262253 [Colletotrichum somersetense]|nr:hypothetical protein LZ31DRAFT_262253 [Colletotrichum somersetense]